MSLVLAQYRMVALHYTITLIILQLRGSRIALKTLKMSGVTHVQKLKLVKIWKMFCIIKAYFQNWGILNAVLLICMAKTALIAAKRPSELWASSLLFMFEKLV